MKKILIVIESMQRGGTQKNVYNLIQRINSKNYKINIVTFNKNKENILSLGKSVDSHYLKMPDISRNIFQAVYFNIKRTLILRRFFSKNKPDIILSFIFTTNILVILSSLFINKRVIVCERNDPQNQKLHFIWLLLRKILYKKASMVTVNSLHALSFFSKTVQEKKLKYIPNFTNSIVKSNSKIYVKFFLLAVGRLTYQKGFDILIKDFLEVRKKYVNLKLIILGSGPELNNLKKIIPKNCKEILFLGDINPIPYFKKCEAFILSSRYEGVPNVLIEAMSFSKPIIIYNSSSGMEEYVSDMNEAIILNQNRSINSLKKAVKYIFENKSKVDLLSKNAKNKVLSFDNKKIFDLWLEVLSNK